MSSLVFNSWMSKQDLHVLGKFVFLESILSRYESNSYNQLQPLVDNPQTLYESFAGKTVRAELYAVEVGYGEVYVILSELIEWDGQEIRSWYSVGFKRNDSEEITAPVYDKFAHCPFCEEKTYFSTDLPLEELQIIFHCKRCRNFFDPTSKILRFLGSAICLFLSVFSLFSLLVGCYIFAMYVWQGLLFNRFTLISICLIAGGAGTLFFLAKKMWTAFSDPMLRRVSNFEIYLAPEN